ncbi:MAG: hypothetical protein AAFO03_21430 [Bacteroidota bacterium]
MDNNMRYPGPKPFAANQSHLFYGREQESKRLLGLMQNQQLTVLYGRSGYGKSSLLNAAVLPKMQEDGYQVINVRLGAWTPQSTNTPLRSTVQAIAENPEHLEKTILDELIQWDNSLWYYTKTFAINTERPKLLFVFDQFEELFTYPIRQIELYENSLAELLKTSLPQRYRDQMKQKKELRDHPQRSALFDRLDIKVVIAIRSNRFHLLERLSSALPTILQNTLELDALEREGARSAIVGPAAEKKGTYATPTFTYSDEVQERILDFLNQEGKIEGILLQMLCSYFERLILKTAGKREVELQDLHLSSDTGRGEVAGLEQIVDQYYRDRIDDLPDEQEETVKRFIEDNLVQRVGNGGMRLSMHQAQIKDRFGIEADTLNTLVGNGLLRTEPFLRGGVTYELTHDRLITPVLKSKAAFDAGEAERLKKQLEAEEAKRKEAETLRARAEKAKAEAEEERTKALAAEKEALEAREMAEEKRAIAVKAKAVAERNERRANILSMASGIAVAVAAVLGIWAYINLLGVRRERADKNLILCKEYVINAKSLAQAGYCDSARELIGRAEKLIDDYGDSGKEETCLAYEYEHGNLDNVRALVDNKQKAGSCQVD